MFSFVLSENIHFIIQAFY